MPNAPLLLLLLAAVARAGAFSPFETLRFDVTPDQLSEDCASAKKRAASALAEIASLPATARTFDNSVWALDPALFDLSDPSDRKSVV